MSSPFDNDSEASGSSHRVGQSLRPGQNIQDDLRSQQQSSNAMPHPIGSEHDWAQRQSMTPGTNTLTTPPFSRHVPLVQTDPNRYGTAPFAMSNMPAEARRQNIMAMDRKRRLTGSTHENGGRRRTHAGAFNERDETLFGRPSDSFPSSSRSPTTQHRNRYGPSASADVIDLTNSPPANNFRPTVTRSSTGPTPGVYVVPRWQPDSDVTECPICSRPFSLWFRRHHCRKCGRVVCNDCSPHRITIPRQFIVNAPGPYMQMHAVGDNTVDLTGDDDDDDDDDQYFGSSSLSRYHRTGAIGGGEKVRLCNPCVPDPQPEPRPNYNSSTLSGPQGSGRREDLLTLSDALRSSRHDYPHNSVESFPSFAAQPHLAYPQQGPRARPLPLLPVPRSDSEHNAPQQNSLPFLSNDRYRQRSHHMSFDNPQTMHQRYYPLDLSRQHTQSGNRPRVRSMLDESYMPRLFPNFAPPSRMRVNEEDICPICRRILPPKGLSGDESARESHIVDCINSRDPSNQATPNRGTVGNTFSPPRGPMHMLPFMATEKDCVSDDGNVPECSICMVEYDVGDALARLECLCKFHKECISAWFTRKQECPVHKIS